MKIYLAGPIAGCTDEQAKGWREQVKELHPDVLDPMDRDYRGKEADNIKDIVEKDKQDIDNSDGLLVYIDKNWFERPSVGTSMEVLYAWERKIPVVIINVSGRNLSPWLIYHSANIYTSIKDGLKFYGTV